MNYDVYIWLSAYLAAHRDRLDNAPQAIEIANAALEAARAQFPTLSQLTTADGFTMPESRRH